jgi:hypothetical protein
MPSPRAYRATGNITVASFVTLATSANHSVSQAGANSIPIGISQQGGGEAPLPSVTANPVVAATAGQTVDVVGEGEVTLLRLGTGGAAPGDLLKPDANGQGIKLAGTAGALEWYGARSLEAGVAGALVRVVTMIGSVRNAPA